MYIPDYSLITHEAVSKLDYKYANLTLKECRTCLIGGPDEWNFTLPPELVTWLLLCPSL